MYGTIKDLDSGTETGSDRRQLETSVLHFNRGTLVYRASILSLLKGFSFSEKKTLVSLVP